MDEDGNGVIEFCERVRPRLVGTLSLLCGDGGVAEELAQEALARLWDRWKHVRGLGEPAASAWVYRTGVNLANSWARRKMAERRMLVRLGGWRASHASDADVADAVAIRREVAALPRRQRTALVLRYYADLPVDQVAALMGCAPGTVKALTHKAIRALRKQIVVPLAEEVPDAS